VDEDPCTRFESCNTSVALCEWDILDGDFDGHAPPSCGGDDPDDADAAAFPGAREICNDKDDDADGYIDENPAASEYCGGAVCEDGVCVGCTSEPDRTNVEHTYTVFPGGSVLSLSLFGLVAWCDALNTGIAPVLNCVDSNASSVYNQLPAFSTQCRNDCLPILLSCSGGCGCGYDIAPECATCVCDDGCLDEFEACAGVPVPFACN
jgi:hypothetical protein